MAINTLSLKNDYWDNFKIQERDLEFLYNHLLELEIPQTAEELVDAMVRERIRIETEGLTKRQTGDSVIYTPNERYQIGDILSFPALNWKQGRVIDIRQGHNPEYTAFDVVRVEIKPDEIREFASGFENHVLNQPIKVTLDDPQLDPSFVLGKFGESLVEQLNEVLAANPDLVRIAGRWFPRALLVDVNIGHLNLAEAVLDMAGGGPLSTKDLLEQIDLPTDVNPKLTEFSLNLALQEDGRFDEIGPAGEVVWFLKRLEPEFVQNTPAQLKYSHFEIDLSQIENFLSQLDPTVVDELEQIEPTGSNSEELVLSLIFPHWRAGTLPLSKRVSRFFPTAYESPRVRFNFLDSDTGQQFSGWVVRSARYVYGLKDWYSSQNLIPGSLIRIKRSRKPGEVIIRADRHRPTREWVRTALIGADGGLVFAMLKQMVSCSYDERMVTAIPDVSALDQIWETSNRSKQAVDQTILSMMRELSKLNPQGHVHFQELYTSVNLVRRCPPSHILSILVNKEWVHHLGDLYFKLTDLNKGEVS